jgi:hypothetical protein
MGAAEDQMQWGRNGRILFQILYMSLSCVAISDLLTVF